jgi:hypothetical protein
LSLARIRIRSDIRRITETLRDGSCHIVHAAVELVYGVETAAADVACCQGLNDIRSCIIPLSNPGNRMRRRLVQKCRGRYFSRSRQSPRRLRYKSKSSGSGRLPTLGPSWA